jgi:hypothetical protein
LRKYTLNMERRSVTNVNSGSVKDRGPKEIQESEVAFGPYRHAVPGEKCDSEDLASGGLLPIRKYGPGVEQSKSDQS